MRSWLSWMRKMKEMNGRGPERGHTEEEWGEGGQRGVIEAAGAS